jgi:polysaccharide export outer membrane protein
MQIAKPVTAFETKHYRAWARVSAVSRCNSVRDTGFSLKTLDKWIAGWHRRKIIASAFGTVIILLAGGCQDVTTAATAPTAYTLGPGDKVRVIVFEHEDLSGNFEIDSAGRIALPLVRGIDAQGLTIPNLEQVIGNALKNNHVVSPIVSVDLIKARPFCVLGEVKNPGCFDYMYEMRAAKAIASAGGYTYRARERNFVIVRQDGTRVAGNHDTPILPGDVIEVSERLF